MDKQPTRRRYNPANVPQDAAASHTPVPDWQLPDQQQLEQERLVRQQPTQEQLEQARLARMRREKKKKALRRKKRIRRLILLLIALLLLLVIAGGTAAYFIQRAGTYEKYEFDAEAMAGRIQQMTEEEIQAELNRVVDEGMFNISIASAILFNGPDGEGEARIENIAANHYHMQVDILLDETGETVYSSKLIKPGYSIKNIRLDKRLEPGEYPATAVFSAITQEEKQVFGTVAAQIRLYVTAESPEQ